MNANLKIIFVKEKLSLETWPDFTGFCNLESLFMICLSVIRTHFISADDFDIKLKKLEAQMHDTEIYTVLDSYIRVIGSFPNSCLKHQLGVEVLNGKLYVYLLNCILILESFFSIPLSQNFLYIKIPIP